jgi:hypothetical protein
MTGLNGDFPVQGRGEAENNALDEMAGRDRTGRKEIGERQQEHASNYFCEFGSSNREISGRRRITGANGEPCHG